MNTLTPANRITLDDYFAQDTYNNAKTLMQRYDSEFGVNVLEYIKNKYGDYELLFDLERFDKKIYSAIFSSKLEYMKVRVLEQQIENFKNELLIGQVKTIKANNEETNKGSIDRGRSSTAQLNNSFNNQSFNSSTSSTEENDNLGARGYNVVNGAYQTNNASSNGSSTDNGSASGNEQTRSINNEDIKTTRDLNKHVIRDIVENNVNAFEEIDKITNFNYADIYKHFDRIFLDNLQILYLF